MRLRNIIFSTVLLAVTGCGGGVADDLHKFVTEAHADRKPRVEPLPEIKINETFLYSASAMVDPFAAFNLRPSGNKSAGGPMPDMNRRKEPLEDYPLDSLKMVGTLQRGQSVWAVIKAPDGTVHRAKLGDHMGQNFGMVTNISEEKVELVELVQGSAGDWVERNGNLAIEE